MKILLPVDGSEVSLKAVRVALAMKTQGLAAEMVLANVQEPANLYEMMTAPDPEVLERVSQAAGMDILARRGLAGGAGCTQQHVSHLQHRGLRAGDR